MTLNDIIVAALRYLERGSNAQTIDKYRDAFTDYANAGIRRLAIRFKLTRSDEIVLDAKKRFNVNLLPRQCMVIEKITDADGTSLTWDEITTGVIEVSSAAAPETTVEVFYRYIPKELSSSSDTPELPAYMHSAIPYFVVGCQRSGGDGDSQPTAAVYFELFQREVNNIQNSHYGAAKSYTLKNMW